MQKTISCNDVVIFYVEGSAYRIHFWYMSKDDGISLMNNSNLIDKMEVYLNLSDEDKNKNREYGRNRYHNTSEEKRQKLKEYQKNYLEAKITLRFCSHLHSSKSV